MLSILTPPGDLGDVTKRNRREQTLPGNDGRWFLELVGAEEPPPDATTTLARLASPDPAAIPDAESTATVGRHGGVLLGHVTGSSTDGNGYGDPGDLDSAAAVSAALAAADDETEAVMEDWTPEELSRSLRSRRTVRWTVIAVLVVLGAVAAAAIVWLPRAAEQEAEARADEYSAAMADLRNELPGSQDALALVTDPATDAEQLNSVIPATAELGARAAVIGDLAAEPLSSRLDFLPGSPMAELEPSRERMSFLAAGGEQVATRIGRGYVYRTTIPQLMVTPLLPASIGDSAAINELSVDLAAALADSVDLVAELPDDPAFASTKQTAISAIDRFEEWIVDYLAALRNGDPEQVQALIREVDGLRSDLEVSTADALLVLRTEVDEQIIELADQTEAAIGALPTF